MLIPKSIKIGTQVWEIREQKRKHSVTTDHFGFTNVGDNVIIIDSEITESRKRVILVHELLHAIMSTFGGSYVPEKKAEFADLEHYFIGLYEEPLVLVLRENPELVKFLVGNES